MCKAGCKRFYGEAYWHHTVAELIWLYEDLLHNETTTHACLIKKQFREYRKMIDDYDENRVVVHVYMEMQI